MNREDLIKKLELARVGSGTQTYNDVVVTLTKEETLELLKYIEKLEEHNKNLYRLNTEILGESVDIHNENATLKLKLEQLEKELKQTKRNFKNSQTHSKNCYKKLKEKYEKLERAYKNNEELVRDLNELINRNLELRKQIENLEEENKGVKDDNTRLWHSLEYGNNEISKLKQAIKILKEQLGITFYDESCQVYIYEDETYADFSCLISCGEDEYLLLKEMFESVGDSDE